MNDNNKKTNLNNPNDNENFHKEKYKNESKSTFIFKKNQQKKNFCDDYENSKYSNYSNYKSYLNRNTTTNDNTFNKRTSINVDKNQNTHKFMHDKTIKKDNRNKSIKNNYVNSNLYNYNNLIKNSKKISQNPYSEDQKKKKKRKKNNNNDIDHDNNTINNNYTNTAASTITATTTANHYINASNNNTISSSNNNINNSYNNNTNNNDNINNNFNNVSISNEKYLSSDFNFNSYNKKDDYNNQGSINNNNTRKNDTQNANRNKKNKTNILENKINESNFNKSNALKDNENFYNSNKKNNNLKNMFCTSEDNNYNKSNKNNKNNEYTFNNNLTYKKKFNKITLSNNNNNHNHGTSTSVKASRFPHLIFTNNAKNNEEMKKTKNKNKEYTDNEIKNISVNKKLFDSYENKQNYNLIISNSNDNYNYTYGNEKNYLNETNNYYCNNNKNTEILNNSSINNNNLNINTYKNNLNNRNLKKVYYENNMKSSKIYNDDIEFNNNNIINKSNNSSNINNTNMNDGNKSNNFEMNLNKFDCRENYSLNSFKEKTSYSENNNSNIVKMLSKYLKNLNDKDINNFNTIQNELFENKNHETLKSILNTIKDFDDASKRNYLHNEYSKENQRGNNNLSKDYCNQDFKINNARYRDDTNSYNINSSNNTMDKNNYSNNIRFISSRKSNRNNLDERTTSNNMCITYKGENENNPIMNTKQNSELVDNGIINNSNNSLYKVIHKDTSLSKINNHHKFKENIPNEYEESMYEKNKKKSEMEDKMKVAICNYSKKSEEIKEKWNKVILKCKSVNILNNFNEINTTKDNIHIVDIFKISLFNNNNYYLYKNILYNNYKSISIHNKKFLFLENIFKCNKAKDKNELIVCESSISFDDFLYFFNNFYQITESYKNKICFFLIYKILIMNEDDGEYGSYYNLILKILNKNALILFLFILINLMKNYSLKKIYFVNLIERLLPIITKNEKTTKKNKNKTFFNILYFKLFRLIFDKIESFHNHKKHLLLLFLRYIKNFLLNICSSILITQYLFIKCIDLMNKYNNQQYILIKTLSMEIFLQLWNNDFLKLYILKIGKLLIRFLIFISNIEYINKNILSFILSTIENSNQLDIKKNLSNYFYNNKYYLLERKKLKHYLKKFKENMKYSLYLSINDSFSNREEIHLEREDPDKENKNSNINLDINKTKINNNTLLDYIFEIKKSYNYFKILLSHEEKKCLNFLIKMNNQNNNFHFNLFYNLFIQKNLLNLIHENKLIYYIEYIKNTNLKSERVTNFFKENVKLRGLKNIKNEFIFESMERNNKRKNDSLINKEYSIKKKSSEENNNASNEYDIINFGKALNNSDECNSNDYSYIKEKIMYDMHEIIKMSNCVLSKVYCSHIKLSFFFNIFFYKTYDIYKILSSSLSIYSRKFKNFKKDNQKIIRFMNLNNITHFLIIKFLLKSLNEVKSVNHNLFFLKEEKKKKKKEKIL